MPILNPTIQLVLVYLYTKYQHFIFNGSGDIFDERVLRNYEGWTEGRTDGRIDRCKPVYPHFFKGGYKYIIVILHTKYDNSSLHSFTEIFTEFQYLKYGKRENWTNTGNNKHEKAGSKSHETIHHYQLAYQILLL